MKLPLNLEAKMSMLFLLVQKSIYLEYNAMPPRVIFNDFLCFRYTSHFEAPPDISTTSHSSGSKLSRAVRRMMTNAEVEKSKEELAWQMAGMIVKDVTTRSSAPIANCSSATNGVSISAATADS